MTAPATDLDLLLVAISAIPTPWKKWPGGYPDRLDLALVDAVMSIRFRYGRERRDGTWTGARGAVLRYQRHSEHVAPSERMRHLTWLIGLVREFRAADWRRGLNTEFQDALRWVLQQLTGTLQQHTELGRCMRRADMLNDALPAPDIFSDLHPGRARGRPHPSDESHTVTLEQNPLVREKPPTSEYHHRSARYASEISRPVSQVRSERMRHLATQDPVALETVLNRQKVHAGKTKALAIVEAAENFRSAGITVPEHINPHDDDHRKLYCDVTGLGPVTWEYLTMLLSHDGVKADSWITEFVGRAIGRRVSAEDAGRLVKEAAQKLGVDEKTLDHAIWSHASTTGLKI